MFVTFMTCENLLKTNIKEKLLSIFILFEENFITLVMTCSTVFLSVKQFVWRTTRFVNVIGVT